jgi:hypothetical protein
LIAALLADVPPTAIEKSPELSLEPTGPAVPKDEHQGFAEFYRVYPLHVARGAAERAYRRIIKTVKRLRPSCSPALCATRRRRTARTRPISSIRRGKCWLDEPAPAAARPPSYLESIRAGLAVHPDEEGA